MVKMVKKKKSKSKPYKMKKKVRDFTPVVYGLWNDRMVNGKKYKPWKTTAYRDKEDVKERIKILERSKPHIKLTIIKRKVESTRSGKRRDYYIPYWRKKQKENVSIQCKKRYYVKQVIIIAKKVKKVEIEQFQKINKEEILKSMRKSIDKEGNIRKHPDLMKNWKSLQTSMSLFTHTYNEAVSSRNKGKSPSLSVSLLNKQYKRDSERHINKILSELKKRKKKQVSKNDEKIKRC